MASPTTAVATAAPARAAVARRLARPRAPRIDIYETEQSYVLLADVPGLTPEGLEVIAERDSLIVRGDVEPSGPADYQEFELGDYYRSFTLTDDLDADRISATLRDGVLRVEIPKSPGVLPKKIPVRSE